LFVCFGYSRSDGNEYTMGGDLPADAVRRRGLEVRWARRMLGDEVYPRGLQLLREGAVDLESMCTPFSGVRSAPEAFARQNDYEHGGVIKAVVHMPMDGQGDGGIGDGVDQKAQTAPRARTSPGPTKRNYSTQAGNSGTSVMSGSASSKVGAATAATNISALHPEPHRVLANVLGAQTGGDVLGVWADTHSVLRDESGWYTALLCLTRLTKVCARGLFVVKDPMVWPTHVCVLE
jgi:hypothetical protein